MGTMIKEHVGVIILAVFILVAVFGPMYVERACPRPVISDFCLAREFLTFYRGDE